ncbi:MAG: hypothetical protein ABIR96_02935 [Bdellovibrionota bacterium]
MKFIVTIAILFATASQAETLPPKSGFADPAQEREWIALCNGKKPDALACYNLGVTEAQDRDNEPKGIEYYKKACGLGEALACFNLGGLLIKNRQGAVPVVDASKRVEGAAAFEKTCALFKKNPPRDADERSLRDQGCSFPAIIRKNSGIEYNALLKKMGLI